MSTRATSKNDMSGIVISSLLRSRQTTVTSSLGNGTMREQKPQTPSTDSYRAAMEYIVRKAVFITTLF